MYFFLQEGETKAKIIRVRNRIKLSLSGAVYIPAEESWKERYNWVWGHVTVYI
jgi:hypothetical protein